MSPSASSCARSRTGRRADGGGLPVAAAQVRRWLAEQLPTAEIVPAYSNAAAAGDVAEGRADAGVTTALAAERYGLATLADAVVDRPNARTRFVLVGRPGRRRRGPAPTVPRWCCASTTPGCAGIGDERVRHPRHRPDQDRIPAHPNRTRHLRLLPGLRGPHRRQRGGRGAQGAAPALRRRPLPRVPGRPVRRRDRFRRNSTRPSSG